LKHKFWAFVTNKDNTRTLYLEGVIAEDSWWGDEITPKMFKEDLKSGSGDITVWINSPGGDVFAAAQIYNMLMEYPGHIIIKIDGIAASAASVIAMAGSEVLMSPVSIIMIHNPATIAWGDSEEMLRAKALLDEVKECIINAYELRTNLSRVKLSHMMSDETWMNAKKAVELGFADGILYVDDEPAEANTEPEFVWNRMRMQAGNGMLFSRQAVTNSILRKLPNKEPPTKTESEKPTGLPPATPGDASASGHPASKQSLREGTPIESLFKRLSLLS